MSLGTALLWIDSAQPGTYNECAAMRNTLPLVAVLVVVALFAFFAWRGSEAEPDVRSTAPTTAEPTAKHVDGAPESAAVAPAIVAPENVSDGEPNDRTLAAQPSDSEPASPTAETTIVGRCVDFDGQPLALVRIGIRHPRAVDAETDADGRFRILCTADTAQRARVTLRAGRRWVVTAEREVLLVQHSVNDVGEWRLERGGLVAGRVVDSDGRPVEGARVVPTRGVDVLLDGARRQDVWSDEADTRTDAAGVFELEAVQPGRVRVWATKSRFFNAVGDAFDLRAEEERRGLELVLEPEAPEDGVDIHVLLPDGTPCTDAQVRCEYTAPSISGTTFVPCDDQGRGYFRLVVGALHDFRATDRGGKFGEAVVTGVERGHPPIVLRLGSAERTVLRVVDEAGALVPSASATIYRIRDNGRSGSSADRGRGDEPGRFTFVPPTGRWLVGVRAPGFESLELGPFEPEERPKELLATLTRVPGLAGRVLADGKPIANASVQEGHDIASNVTLIVDTFPADREFTRGSSTTTDADGRFVLYPEESGELLLRAEGPGFAPTIVGPIVYDAARGADGVEIELLRGATLEGRVLLPAGESAAGTIVGVSCGDGFARTARTGSDGAYRFERLTPGRWFVRRCMEEISPHSSTSSSMFGDEAAAELPWNVQLQDGETVRFDLDLRVDPRPRARGRFSIAGRPLAGWDVVAQTTGDTWGDNGATHTDEHGAFDVRAASAGSGFLTLHQRIDDAENRVLSIPIDWGPSELVLEHDLPGGRVQLSRAPSNEPSRWFGFTAKDAATGGSWELNVQLAPGASRTLEDVPVGEWIVTPTGVAGTSVYDALQVRAGETATYAVP